MALESKQLKCLNYLYETVLPRINGTGNYNFNLVGNIYKKEISPERLGAGRFPAVFIRDQGSYGVQLHNTSLGVEMGETRRNDDGWPVAIVGILKAYANQGDDWGLIEDAINLQTDIQLAIATDISLGGNCDTCVVTAIGKRPPQGREDIYGFVTVVLSIKYSYNPYATPAST